MILRDAWTLTAKDLLIEWRSKVVINQIAPFALLVLVLFGFALDADERTLQTFSSGLFWVTVMLAALFAVQRAFTVEDADGAADGLLLAGFEPASIYLGKAAAVLVQILVLEAVLTAGIIVFYGADIESIGLYVAAALVAAVAIAGAGTIYGALAVGLRVRETILPILLLPVLAPVLIGATRAFDDALGSAAVDGWAWMGLLGLFAVVVVGLGVLAFGTLMEDS